MKIPIAKQVLLGFFLFVCTGLVYADGISVDAGLTPAQDRWILRTQYRLMSMNNTMMETRMHGIPLVVAYGLTPKITLMAKQAYMIKTTIANKKTTVNGFDDPFFLVKMKAFRKNTENSTFGIAPVLASNIPIGNDKISAQLWSPMAGVNCSYRRNFWLFDFNAAYTFKDINKQSAAGYNDALNLNAAFSRLMPFKNNSDNLLVALVEVSYLNELNAGSMPPAKNLYASPGFKLVFSSLVFEGLYQIPLTQNATGMAMKNKGNLIVGLRYMM